MHTNAATTYESVSLPLDEAFAPLLAYDKRLVNIALRVLGDREEALDAVQEAYLHAYCAFHGFRGDAQPFTWLCRITLNECARRGRKMTTRRRREVNLEVLHATGRDPGENDAAHGVVDRSRTARAVRDAVSTLPGVYRDVIVLRYYEHMSYAEIADIAGCSLGTVKSRLSRAHQRLNKMIPEEYLADMV